MSDIYLKVDVIVPGAEPATVYRPVNKDLWVTLSEKKRQVLMQSVCDEVKDIIDTHVEAIDELPVVNVAE